MLQSLLMAIALLFSLPGIAAATVQPSGRFGQPHESVVSGNFTFIVQTKGPVDRVLFNIWKPNQVGDISKSLGNYTQTSISKGSDDTQYFNLVWNSTGFADGEYWLMANVESDTATPNGFRDAVTHVAGGLHLAFKVQNPKVIPPPVVPPENACQAKVGGAKKYAEQLYAKQNSNLTFIDNFAQQTTFFYKNNSSSVKNHDKEITDISVARKAASDQVVQLNGLKNFTCDNNLRTQVTNYLSVNAAARNKLDTYKDAVISLMVKLLGEYK